MFTPAETLRLLMFPSLLTRRNRATFRMFPSNFFRRKQVFPQAKVCDTFAETSENVSETSLFALFSILECLFPSHFNNPIIPTLVLNKYQLFSSLEIGQPVSYLLVLCKWIKKIRNCDPSNESPFIISAFPSCGVVSFPVFHKMKSRT